MNCTAVIKELQVLALDAKSCRSHSVVDFGIIRRGLRERGNTHESNLNIPEGAGIALNPFVGTPEKGRYIALQLVSSLRNR